MQCCCCSHINSHNQVRGHRTGSSHSGTEEYPREKAQTNQRWYTHISQLTQFMPPPETYKSEIGSQPTMCQVHTAAYVSLLAPGKTDYTACHSRKTTYNVHYDTPAGMIFRAFLLQNEGGAPSESSCLGKLLSRSLHRRIARRLHTLRRRESSLGISSVTSNQVHVVRFHRRR